MSNTTAPTRADRIAAGDLIEIPLKLSKEANLLYPTAISRAAWEDCVAWADADNARKGTVQDQDGRLWDVLWMTYIALSRMPRGNRQATVRLYRVPRDGRARAPRPTTLAVRISTGDGQQVITIAHPNEA